MGRVTRARSIAWAGAVTLVLVVCAEFALLQTVKGGTVCGEPRLAIEPERTKRFCAEYPGGADSETVASMGLLYGPAAVLLVSAAILPVLTWRGRAFAASIAAALALVWAVSSWLPAV